MTLKLKTIKKWLEQKQNQIGVLYQNFASKLNNYWAQHGTLQLEQELLFRMWEPTDGGNNLFLLILPHALQRDVLEGFMPKQLA